MESLRRTFGIAEPVRRGMEMKIVASGEWRPACLGGSAGVGMDVLKGADMGELGWEDIFTGIDIYPLSPLLFPFLFLLSLFPRVEVVDGISKISSLTSFPFHSIGDETREPADFHTEMEMNFRMNW